MCANRVKSESASGRAGLADLVRVSETKARIEFHPDDKHPKEEVCQIDVRFGEDGTIPEYVPFKLMKNGSKIAIQATVNEEGSKLMYAKPASGYFKARFDKFVSNDDNPPVMETKKSKKGGKTYRDFGALIEVIDGDWQGIKIRDGVWKGAKYYYKMYDNFAAGEGGGLAVKGSGSGSDNLADFLDATVGGGEEIPFSENPLPEIQKLAQEQNRTFEINVAKGWIVSLVIPLELDTVEEIGFLGEEDETPEALKD